MESPRKRHNSKFSTRLLIACLFLLITTTAFSEDFTSLEFSQKGHFFVGEECSLTLTIPNTYPSNIGFAISPLSDKVTLIGIEKTADISLDNEGKSVRSTKIELIIKFSEAGTYNFSPISLIVDYLGKFAVNFPEIIVTPNVLELTPELLFTPTDNMQALSTTNCILSARYISNVLDYSVELSENALIEETQTLFMPQEEGQFSIDAIPIAKFECIPFTSGTLVLKNITATVIDYDGKTHTIVLENFEIPVLEKASYTESFEHQQQLAQSQTNIQITHEIEDKNTEFAKAIHEEWVTKKNTKKPLIITGFCISILLTLISIALIIFNTITKKSSKKGTRLLILSIILLFITILFTYEEKKLHGITYTTNMYGIPEFDGQILSTLESGTRVKIKNNMDGWLLIQNENNATGWILEQDCLLIQ